MITIGARLQTKGQLLERIRTLEQALGMMADDKKFSLGKAVDQYLEYAYDKYESHATVQAQSKVLRSFIKHFGPNKPVARIDTIAINEWINGMTAQLSSMRKMLELVGQFFRWLKDKEVIPVNPCLTAIIKVRDMEHSRKEKVDRGSFDDESLDKLEEFFLRKYKVLDAEKLAKQIEGSNFAAGKAANMQVLLFYYSTIVLMRYTGIRVSDACCLQYEHFQQIPGKLILHTRKTNRRVVIPLNEKCMRVINMLPPQHKDASDRMWVWPKMARSMGPGGNYSDASRTFHWYCKRAGMSCTSFHQIRHYFARKCKEQGISMPHIASLLGHSNTNTTAIYTGRWNNNRYLTDGEDQPQ